MSTIVEQQRYDHDHDGVLDTINSTIKGYDSITNLQLFETRIFEDLHGGMITTDFHSYAYDTSGRKIADTNWIDRFNYGVLEYNGTTSYTYNVLGKLATEVRNSPDFDGDGTPDYVNETVYSYNSAGQILSKHLTNYAFGTNNPGDYRYEDWTYGVSGNLATYQIDDPNSFDCIITNYYRYNKAGLLQDIKISDEIRFGDARPRIDESWTYNKDGTVKTHTSWADYSDKGWFQRVDDNYTSWDGKGYDVDKIVYDLQGDFDPEAIKLIENWFNKDGHLTHTLISHDDQGDGGLLPGGGATSGYDYRDLFVKTWENNVMIAETHDFGADGIIEYQFSSETLL